MGLSGDEIIPIKADANDLPFAHEFFDAIICTDSYNYFGRDSSFLDEKIIPFIKPGGYVYIAVPGMKRPVITICLTNYCFPGMRNSWIIFMIWIIGKI